VPAGRKFFVLYATATYYYWTTGAACKTYADQNQIQCGGGYTLTVSGAGAAYQDSASNPDGITPPSGTGWSPPAPCTAAFCMFYEPPVLLPNSVQVDSLNVASKSVFQVFVPPPAGGTVTVTYTLSSAAFSTSSPQASVTIIPDIQFLLTQTPKTFRPRDARDPLSVSVADGGTLANGGPACGASAPFQQDDNCHPVFTASFSQPFLGVLPTVLQAVPASVKFTLEHTANQPTWLAGSSTNFDGPGAAPDTTAFPDFVFESSQNPNLLPPR
jgi:hypothetical protein